MLALRFRGRTLRCEMEGTAQFVQREGATHPLPSASGNPFKQIIRRVC